IIWRQLRHRNVLPFIGVCDNLMTEVNLLVSPWMDNGDLSTFMKKYEEGGRYVDGIDFVPSGLEYLHSQDPQILHCDLRAGNIVVNEKLELLIIDFGVANYSQIKSQKMSDPNSAGTLHWMAPELFDPPPGSKATTGSSKSDVYAYAMTCFEIFSGTMPFSELPRPVAVMHQVLNGKRPRRPRGNADMRGLNDYVWSLIEACWSHETTKRPSMTDVLRSLDKMENHSVLIVSIMLHRVVSWQICV
ncbi:kinase-like protein, partial [Fomitiporia mediterranea MF3/22]|uniref:kinase-like protein n=1 Tax=Fomitiporia mediterranea (strain MF3/22) TaxID=694068 RepID=UPI00044090D2